MAKRDYYEILGVDKNASDQEIALQANRIVTIVDGKIVGDERNEGFQYPRCCLRNSK